MKKNLVRDIKLQNWLYRRIKLICFYPVIFTVVENKHASEVVCSSNNYSKHNIN